jgi:hypothetical protein
MDYQKELKKVEEGGNYWKPKPGKFVVRALTELEDADPFVKKATEDKPSESTPQAKIKILVAGEERIWTFGLGVTLASTFGQLVKLATEHNNTLIGYDFTVAVKSDGNKNDYTVFG